ncbi:hypothetical protein DL96DRAFT_1812724 [Flagelloscypha sp. PMI_526]|nr:hypothetical protein DL96DRAFT_1812724 [Flagelloscypha sp. PMI_526]
MPTYLDEALNKLEANKQPFIKAIESRIYNKIRHTSRLDCTAIVERHSGYSTTIRLTDPKDYARRFVHFVRTDARNRRYKGNDLDSYLSDDIAEIVQEEYSKYITDNVDELGKAIRTMIADNKVITNSFRRQIVINLKNSTTPLTAHAAEKMADALMQSLNIGDQAASQLGHHISGAIGSATGHHVVMMIAHSLTGVLGTAIAHTIAKFLASAAGKHLLAVVIKKIAVKAVVTGVATMLASACGVAASGALIWWIVLPVIAAFAAYEAYEFPEKLAEKVSKGVSSEMSGELKNRNRELVMGIFKDLTKDSCKEFAIALVKNDTVQHAVALSSNMKAIDEDDALADHFRILEYASFGTLDNANPTLNCCIALQYTSTSCTNSSESERSGTCSSKAKVLGCRISAVSRKQAGYEADAEFKPQHGRVVQVEVTKWP